MGLQSPSKLRYDGQMIAETALIAETMIDAQRTPTATPAIFGEQEIRGENLRLRQAISQKGADEHLVQLCPLAPIIMAALKARLPRIAEEID